MSIRNRRIKKVFINIKAAKPFVIGQKVKIIRVEDDISKEFIGKRGYIRYFSGEKEDFLTIGVEIDKVEHEFWKDEIMRA